MSVAASTSARSDASGLPIQAEGCSRHAFRYQPAMRISSDCAHVNGTVLTTTASVTYVAAGELGMAVGDRADAVEDAGPQGTYEPVGLCRSP